MENTITNELVNIYAGGVMCSGYLLMPDECSLLVIFCHEGGDSRHSYVYKQTAEELYKNGIASLVIDLITGDEDMFDYNKEEKAMTERLEAVTEWALNERKLALPLAYYGGGSGSASALKNSIKFKDRVKAVVSIGGRPDLVMNELKDIGAAVLLIIGENDYIGLIKLNQIAYSKLNCKKQIILIPAASHSFEEPGKHEEVMNHAVSWFIHHS